MIFEEYLHFVLIFAVNRWFLLDKALISVDNSVESLANGKISCTIPASVEFGKMNIYLLATDSMLNERLYFHWNALWDSKSTWLNDGNVAMLSELRISDSVTTTSKNLIREKSSSSAVSYLVDRALSLNLNYDDGIYEFKSSHEECSSGTLLNQVIAAGKYGGNMDKW